MIYIGLYTLLPPVSIYYTPPSSADDAEAILSNPPFVADRVPLDAPTAPGKTLPATTITDRLQPTD